MPLDTAPVRLSEQPGRTKCHGIKAPEIHVKGASPMSHWSREWVCSGLSRSEGRSLALVGRDPSIRTSREEGSQPASSHRILAPVQWVKQVSATDWPHTKSWDISLDCHIWIYRGIIRSKIVFLESVTFQLHARMLSSEVAQLFKSYGHFSDLGVEIALSHRHVEFFW